MAGRRRRVIAVTHGNRARTRHVNGSVPTTLTGRFDTAQLPKVAPDPVTVTVARMIAPGTEAQYLRWADEAIGALRQFPGCLGAGVLHPGPDGGEHQIVFRFIDGVHLRRWERSPERAALMERAAPYVLSERVQRTVGVEDWFELSERAEPKRSLWQRIATDVLWVYPVAIGAAVFLTPRVGALSLGWRVLVTTAIMTVVTRLALGPLRAKMRARRRL